MTNTKQQKRFPFTAIAGQKAMKKALLLNLINPKIGGVLIQGEKGTAKSTIVRALAQLQAGMEVVDLPIGASEDKVVGSLDIEHAIQKGEKQFEPGILFKAHKNILYVDEINLLEDHLVDILLDVAAMGVNTVERESISHSHPSEFILVGTMNPEEGDIRPQLLDRFGLTIEVKGEKDLATRIEILQRRLEFEQNPDTFCQKYTEAEEKLSQDIEKARQLLPNIKCPTPLYELIAQIALTIGVDGHRADLVMLKTAITLAAFHQRTEVNTDDVYEAATLALPHRMKRLPFENREFSVEQLKDLIENSTQQQNAKQCLDI